MMRIRNEDLSKNACKVAKIS